jgi:hypothetical protein
MHENTQDALNSILDIERKILLKAIPPRWFNYTIAVLTGLFFLIVVEFGKLGLLIPVLMLSVVAYQYRKAGVVPYFFRSSKDVLAELKGQLSGNIFYTLFIVGGTILAPFLLIKVLELKAEGYVFSPYAGGVLISVFVLIAAENSRKFYLKRYGS